MEEVQRCHESLLLQRTQIRNHKRTLDWMKRCWKAVPHENASVMSQDEYEDMYSILLYEMTICWDEDLNNAILAKMWQRDAARHSAINWARFCCSLFYFIEMWVEEITLDEYERIFCYVHLVLSGQEHMAASHATSPTAATTFKPTLESFDNALDNDKAMEELQMNFGKSISFNAAEYYQHFGAPSMSTHAFQTTLLQVQRRVRNGNSYSNNTACERAALGLSSMSRNFSTERLSTSHCDRSPYKSDRTSNRPFSALQRPMSSRSRSHYTFVEDTSEMISSTLPMSRSPLRQSFSPGRQIMTMPTSASPLKQAGHLHSPLGDAVFVLAGRAALRSPQRVEH